VRIISAVLVFAAVQAYVMANLTAFGLTEVAAECVTVIGIYWYVRHVKYPRWVALRKQKGGD
jgi:hypothetical protein